MSELLPALQATGALTGWAAAVTALGVLLGFFIKNKTIQGRSDDSLRHDLLDEIGRLRSENIEERKDCDRKIEDSNERHRIQIKEMGERHDRQIVNLENEISGLRAEIKQMNLSYANIAGIPIAGSLLEAFPLRSETKRKVGKLNDESDAT